MRLETFREQTVSLVLLVVSEMIAGYIFMQNSPLIISIPGLLILAPALMDLRGDVYGAFAFRTVTAMHLGMAEPKLLTRFNFVNGLAAAIVSIIASSIIGCLAFLLSVTILGTTDTSLVDVVFVSLLTSVVSFIIIVPFATLILIESWKKGGDPRNYAAPMISSIGDIITPLMLFLIVKAVFASSTVKIATTIVLLLAASISIILLRNERFIYTTLKENLPVAVIVALISGLGGLVLSLKAEKIVSTGLLSIVPAFNALLGAAAGIIANHLSIIIRVGLENIRKEFVKISKNVIPPYLIALIFSLITPIISNGITLLEYYVVVVIVSLISGVIGFIVLSSISYAFTIITFNQGLDPDNIVFPILSTGGDLLGPILLTTFLLLFT